VLTGPNAVAGEWGHNPMPWPATGEWPGPPCYCGRTGCLETFLSGPGLVRDYLAGGGRDRKEDTLDAAAVQDRAREGDLAARHAVERHAARLARALAAVINILDPDTVVLGGGLSNIEELYGRVPDLWRPFVFSDTVHTRLVRARHGDSSGVRGAAWLWGR
jgi:fructokinase